MGLECVQPETSYIHNILSALALPAYEGEESRIFSNFRRGKAYLMNSFNNFYCKHDEIMDVNRVMPLTASIRIWFQIQLCLVF